MTERVQQGQETYALPQKDAALPRPPIEGPLKLNAETSSCFYKGLLGSSAAVLYTAPYRTKSEIKEIHVCNKSSTDRTFTIRVVPYGSSTSDDYALYCAYAIKAKESITFHHKTHLFAGWFISALASNANDISVQISGIEVVVI